MLESSDEVQISIPCSDASTDIGRSRFQILASLKLSDFLFLRGKRIIQPPLGRILSKLVQLGNYEGRSCIQDIYEILPIGSYYIEILIYREVGCLDEVINKIL